MIPDNRDPEDDEACAYDIPTAARRLGNVTERTVWNLMAAGEIRSFKAGRRRLISKRALIDYIERQEALEVAA